MDQPLLRPGARQTCAQLWSCTIRRGQRTPRRVVHESMPSCSRNKITVHTLVKAKGTEKQGVRSYVWSHCTHSQLLHLRFGNQLSFKFCCQGCERWKCNGARPHLHSSAAVRQQLVVVVDGGADAALLSILITCIKNNATAMESSP